MIVHVRLIGFNGFPHRVCITIQNQVKFSINRLESNGLGKKIGDKIKIIRIKPLERHVIYLQNAIYSMNNANNLVETGFHAFVQKNGTCLVGAGEVRREP